MKKTPKKLGLSTETIRRIAEKQLANAIGASFAWGCGHTVVCKTYLC
jgi:hypothetical protein